MSKGIQYPFLAHHNVGYVRNVEKTVGPLKKDPRILMQEGYFHEPSVPWEQRIDNGYPNVFYDDTYHEYRFYYTCILHDEASTEFRPEERVDKIYRFYDREKYGPRVAGVLMMTSKDGVNWERPSLGICEYAGSKDNNILLIDAHGASVFKDDRETEPSKRYKMVVRHDATRTMSVAFSSDGIHWGELIDWQEHNPAGDTHNFAFWDDEISKYVVITRTWEQASIRLVARCESDDFIHWSEPVEIYRGEGIDDQVYSMPVFKHNGLYFGLGSILHEGDRASADYDCVDCELIFSSDGYNWERAVPGQKFIPRSKGTYGDGLPDSGCIYASVPVREGDQFVFYYLGGSGMHTNFRESSLMKATVHQDKLVGYKPIGDGVGMIGTQAVEITGDDIHLVADISTGGSIEVAICQRGSFHEEPKPLEGFGFVDSRVNKLENGHFAVDFGSKKPSEIGEGLFTILFRIEGSTIYGYGGEVSPLRRNK